MNFSLVKIVYFLTQRNSQKIALDQRCTKVTMKHCILCMRLLLLSKYRIRHLLPLRWYNGHVSLKGTPYTSCWIWSKTKTSNIRSVSSTSLKHTRITRVHLQRRTPPTRSPYKQWTVATTVYIIHRFVIQYGCILHGILHITRGLHN